jgi:hypothetical protein
MFSLFLINNNKNFFISTQFKKGLMLISNQHIVFFCAFIKKKLINFYDNK